MSRIAPSILGADFSRLGDEIADCDRVGVDLLHLDIMDGHFVPNISFGPGIVKTIDKLSDKFLDCHLMLSEPELYFEPFAEAGADAITFHIEVHPDPRELADRLREMGIRPGLSLNPDASADRVIPYLEHFDLLLVMSVFPGFGGQSFIPSAFDTIRAAREHIDKHNLPTMISVDGGVGPDNAKDVVEAGADILVMGSAFFKSNDRRQLARMVQKLERQGHIAEQWSMEPRDA